MLTGDSESAGLRGVKFPIFTLFFKKTGVYFFLLKASGGLKNGVF
jgi:hypothetical protein